jgi:hypothetical protein
MGRANKLVKPLAIAVIIVLIACTTVAQASYLDIPLPTNGGDDKGGYFALEAISGTDSPATPAVEVDAGAPINVRLTLEMTPEGDMTLPPIPIPVNVYLYLYKDGSVVASKNDMYLWTLPTFKKDVKFTIQEGRSIDVPSGLAPGDYILVAHGYFDLPSWLVDSMIQGSPTPAPGQQPGEIPDAIGATKSWPVTVANSHYSGSITPTPKPVPANTTAMASGGLSFGSDYLNGIMGAPGPHSISGNGIGGTMTVGGGDGSPPLQLITDDISATGVNGASASIAVNFSQPPWDGSIELSILPEPSDDVMTQYVLGAIDSNYDITDIAYVLAVNKTNIENTEYTIVNGEMVPVKQGQVQNALITMKVSPAWVEAHGGKDAIKIMRYDNGTAEALETHYIGTEGGLMVFQGVSPRGLSIFAICAVNSLSSLAHLQAVENPPYGINIPFWEKMIAMVLIAAILLIQAVLAIFLGLGLVVQKAIRRRKKVT